METRLGVFEAGLGVLEAGLGVLEARLGVLEAGVMLVVNMEATWAHVGRQHGGNIESCWLLNMAPCLMPTWSQHRAMLKPQKS